MKSYEQGIPYMDQVQAMPHHLKVLALKGAEVVAERVAVDGNPTFPEVVRGSTVTERGTYVSFESITHGHSVMHMHRMTDATNRSAVMPVRVAESGKGFRYALTTDLTATEARLLIAGL